MKRVVSRTPRTDAREYGMAVPSHFARELETELYAALTENAKLHAVAKELEAAKQVIADDIKLISNLKASAANDQALPQPLGGAQ